jgi:hypothetical protein
MYDKILKEVIKKISIDKQPPGDRGGHLIYRRVVAKWVYKQIRYHETRTSVVARP